MSEKKYCFMDFWDDIQFQIGSRAQKNGIVLKAIYESDLSFYKKDSRCPRDKFLKLTFISHDTEIGVRE